SSDLTKLARRWRCRLPALAPPWHALGGVELDGYEIRNGVVSGEGEQAPGVWTRGPVLATTVHGLFEDPVAVGALTGVTPPPVLDATFDVLADAVDEHLDTAAIRRLLDG